MTPFQKMEFQKEMNAPKIQLEDATVEEVGSISSDMIEMSDMSPPQSDKENDRMYIKFRKLYKFYLKSDLSITFWQSGFWMR